MLSIDDYEEVQGLSQFLTDLVNTTTRETLGLR